MLEINIPEYNAEMYFYCPIDGEPKKNFFITNNNVNTMAVNSMEHKLQELFEQRKDYILLSFICRSSQTNYNILKKCVEIAYKKLKGHLRFDGPLGPSDVQSQEKITPPVQENSSQGSLVDLTSDNESDKETEEFHDIKLHEPIEDVRCDIITSDFEDEIDHYEKAFDGIDWKHFYENFYKDLSKDSDPSFRKETSMKFFTIPLVNDPKPRKIDDSSNRFHNFRPEDYSPIELPEESDDNVPVPSSTPLSKIPIKHGRKLSFGSIYKPQRHTAIMIEPPKNAPREEGRGYNRGPKLNMGRTNETIKLDVKIEKKTPSSNLLNRQETSQWQNSERRLQEISSTESQIQSGFLNSFKIPLKSKGDTSQPSNSSIISNKSQASVQRTTVKYNEPKAVNEKMLNRFSSKVNSLIPYESPTKERAMRSTPSSVKRFFPNSQYEDTFGENSKREVKREKDYGTPTLPKLSKRNTDTRQENPKRQKIIRREECEKISKKIEITDSDDEVIVINENLDENRNVKAEPNQSKNDKKFFKRDKSPASSQVPKYKSSRAKESTTDFYTRLH